MGEPSDPNAVDDVTLCEACRALRAVALASGTEKTFEPCRICMAALEHVRVAARKAGFHIGM